MEVIALGTSAAYPTPERACSGYLIRHGETNIVIDLGSSVTRNLMRYIHPPVVDAIVITHLHQDHFIDLYPLYYYLGYHDLKGLPIDVYGPKGMDEFVMRIFPHPEEEIRSAYNFKDLADWGTFTVGEITCQSIPTRHSAKAFAIRATVGDNVVAYSSDTGFDEVLYEVASNADLFICESAMQQEHPTLLHMTAAQAGMVAAKAGAKQLVLTHIWPDYDPEVSKRMAEEQYSGPVIIAEDNMRFVID